MKSLLKPGIMRLGAAFLLSWATTVTHALTVSHLRVNAVRNPVGLDGTPLFSWQLNTDRRGCCQTKYRIQVFQDEDGATPVYDSGEITSSQSTHVSAKGLSLTPSTLYHWRVWVRDEQGDEATSTEQACFATGLYSTGWSGARWIRSGNNGGVPRFRKTMTLDKPIKSAWLYTTALGLYDLHINGRRVGHRLPDGDMAYEELKPGWTDYRKVVSYSTHDVTHYLRQGTNVLGATVTGGWWSGDITVGYYGRKPVAFLAKLVVTYTDNTRDIIATDTTWTVNHDGPLRLGDIWNGEEYDATKEDGWMTDDTGQSLWSNCIESTDFNGTVASVKGAEVWALQDKALHVKSVNIYEGNKATGTDFGMVNSIRLYDGPATFTLRRGQTAVIDFGQNMVGWTPFVIKGKRGAQMRLRYAEMLNDDGSCSRGNDGPGGSIYTDNLRAARASLCYTFRGDEGGESYCPFSTYFGFRYCEITADDDLEVMEINGLPVSSQTEDSGSIHTDNSSVNQLFSNILWGQRGNLVSIPTDCPQRSERYGWTGDAQVFSRTGMYNAEAEAFYRNYMEELIHAQNDEGAYPDMCPLVYDWLGSAGWSDAGIIIPYNHYLMYGDREQVRRQFPSMERYMGWQAARSEGEWHYPGAGTAYGNWLAYEKCDNRYVSVAYYAYDALLMSRMAQTLSSATNDVYAQKAVQYRKLYEDIRDEFNRRYWIPQLAEDTQSGYVIPLALDLLDGETKEQAKTLLQQAITRNGGLLSTGFLGTSLFLPTLSRCGMTDEAYSLLLQRGYPSWMYSIDQGATTIWERWNSYTLNKGFGPADMNSFNHYAYGAVGEWMYRFMAGIDADENVPGFAHILLRPEPDMRSMVPEGQEHIREVNAMYRSHHGTIASAWKVNEDGTAEYSCTVPPNTQATLYLHVSLFGLEPTEGDVKATEAEGVAYMGTERGRHVYRLVSGHYCFHGTSVAENNCKVNDGCRMSPIVIDRDNSQIRILADDVKFINLYNEGGILLRSAGAGSKTLDMSGIGHGVYVVRVCCGTQHSRIKFVR